MKLLILNFFQQQNIKNPNEPQFVTYEVRLSFKNGYGTKVICTSDDDPPKGVRK